MKPFESIRVTITRKEDYMEVTAISEGTHRLLMDKVFVSAESSPRLTIEIGVEDVEFNLSTKPDVGGGQ